MYCVRTVRECKGSEKEEYADTLTREGSPPAERLLEERFAEGSF